MRLTHCTVILTPAVCPLPRPDSPVCAGTRDTACPPPGCARQLMETGTHREQARHCPPAAVCPGEGTQGRAFAYRGFGQDGEAPPLPRGGCPQSTESRCQELITVRPEHSLCRERSQARGAAFRVSAASVRPQTLQTVPAPGRAASPQSLSPQALNTGPR